MDNQGLRGSDDDRYLLVDGNNVLARAAYVGKKLDLSAHGVDTGALLIFVNLMAKYIRMVGPTHVAVYWDAGHAFRDRRSHGVYKANREVHSGDDRFPFAQAKQFLTWAGIPHRVRPGWEADDLIALTVRLTRGKRTILSGDQDLLQLLDEHVDQIRLPDDIAWTPERFGEKFGYPVHQMPYVKALTGDTGDNVAGVRGIGPKKALKLLEGASWDWDSLMETLTDEQRAQAEMSRDLVDLRYLDYEQHGLSVDNCPSVQPLGLTGPEDMLWGPMLDFLARLEMVSVIEKLKGGSLWVSDPDQVRIQQQTVDAFAGMDQ